MVHVHVVQIVRGFVKIISIPDEESFPKKPSGATLYTLSNYMMFPLVCTPSFEAVYCFIFGRRKVSVARYWMICLVP